MTPERLAEIEHDCNLGVEQQSQLDELLQAAHESIKLREALDAQMGYLDVDCTAPREGPNIPALALVSKRIWYHATDDQENYPFSAVKLAALEETK